jgi:hypothetical protein
MRKSRKFSPTIDGLELRLPLSAGEDPIDKPVNSFGVSIGNDYGDGDEWTGDGSTGVYDYSDVQVLTDEERIRQLLDKVGGSILPPTVLDDDYNPFPPKPTGEPAGGGGGGTW